MWTRRRSNLENLAVEILKMHKKALTMEEITEGIMSIDPDALKGETPKKSLYSVFYRREKRRKENGLPLLFLKSKKSGITFYELNPKAKKDT